MIGEEVLLTPRNAEKEVSIPDTPSEWGDACAWSQLADVGPGLRATDLPRPPECTSLDTQLSELQTRLEAARSLEDSWKENVNQVALKLRLARDTASVLAEIDDLLKLFNHARQHRISPEEELAASTLASGSKLSATG
jgi:hypothetical protein